MESVRESVHSRCAAERVAEKTCVWAGIRQAQGQVRGASVHGILRGARAQAGEARGRVSGAERGHKMSLLCSVTMR